MLCFYGLILYEAKCLKRQKSPTGLSVYLIHYKGWKNRWDEWVFDDRLLDVNEKNMKTMEILKQKQ